MLSGSATLTANKPVVDELFALSIQNAIRVRRTVEVFDYPIKASEEQPLCGETEYET